MPEETLSSGDVVQIDPAANDRFAGCFAIVEESKAWGITASVRGPGNPPGDYPIRLASGQFVKVGSAEWLPAQSGEKGDG